MKPLVCTVSFSGLIATSRLNRKMPIMLKVKARRNLLFRRIVHASSLRYSPMWLNRSKNVSLISFLAVLDGVAEYCSWRIRCSRTLRFSNIIPISSNTIMAYIQISPLIIALPISAQRSKNPCGEGMRMTIIAMDKYVRIGISQYKSPRAVSTCVSWKNCPLISRRR